MDDWYFYDDYDYGYGYGDVSTIADAPWYDDPYFGGSLDPVYADSGQTEYGLYDDDAWWNYGAGGMTDDDWSWFDPGGIADGLDDLFGLPQTTTQPTQSTRPKPSGPQGQQQPTKPSGGQSSSASQQTSQLAKALSDSIKALANLFKPQTQTTGTQPATQTAIPPIIPLAVIGFGVWYFVRKK